MDRTLPPPSLPNPETNLFPRRSTLLITKPFRFLALPKEIRLMVYEQLHPVTRHYAIPLQDSQHHLTVITTTIPGISLLATSRKIQSEASLIFTPRLLSILAQPPTIMIHATHLPGLMDLQDSFSLPRTFWNWFLRHVEQRSKPRTDLYIRQYRAKLLSTGDLEQKMKMATFISDVDTEILEGITSFILRVKKYISTNPPDTMYKHPPLSVVVSIPEDFIGTHVTVTVTPARTLGYRILFPRGPVPHRTRTGFCDVPWLLHRFVYHAAWACDFRSVVSLSVKVRFLDGEGAVVQGWAKGWVESSLHSAAIQGVRDAGRRGKGVLYYAGLAREKEEAML